jgi:hypothetical protein
MNKSITIIVALYLILFVFIVNSVREDNKKPNILESPLSSSSSSSSKGISNGKDFASSIIDKSNKLGFDINGCITTSKSTVSNKWLSSSIVNGNVVTYFQTVWLIEVCNECCMQVDLLRFNIRDLLIYSPTPNLQIVSSQITYGNTLAKLYTNLIANQTVTFGNYYSFFNTSLSNSIPNCKKTPLFYYVDNNSNDKINLKNSINYDLNSDSIDSSFNSLLDDMIFSESKNKFKSKEDRYCDNYASPDCAQYFLTQTFKYSGCPCPSITVTNKACGIANLCDCDSSSCYNPVTICECDKAVAILNTPPVNLTSVVVNMTCVVVDDLCESCASSLNSSCQFQRVRCFVNVTNPNQIPVTSSYTLVIESSIANSSSIYLSNIVESSSSCSYSYSQISDDIYTLISNCSLDGVSSFNNSFDFCIQQLSTPQTIGFGQIDVIGCVNCPQCSSPVTITNLNFVNLSPEIIDFTISKTSNTTNLYCGDCHYSSQLQSLVSSYSVAVTLVSGCLVSSTDLSTFLLTDVISNQIVSNILYSPELICTLVDQNLISCTVNSTVSANSVLYLNYTTLANCNSCSLPNRNKAITLEDTATVIFGESASINKSSSVTEYLICSCDVCNGCTTQQNFSIPQNECSNLFIKSFKDRCFWGGTTCNVFDNSLNNTLIGTYIYDYCSSGTFDLVYSNNAADLNTPTDLCCGLVSGTKLTLDLNSPGFHSNYTISCCSSQSCGKNASGTIQIFYYDESIIMPPFDCTLYNENLLLPLNPTPLSQVIIDTYKSSSQSSQSSSSSFDYSSSSSSSSSSLYH